MTSREITSCIPGNNENATIPGTLANEFDAVGQLVHPLPRVVGLTIDIISPTMTPLEAVNRTQVSFNGELGRKITVLRYMIYD